MSKKFATVFRDFSSFLLTKDVGMIPMSMTSILGEKSDLYYWDRNAPVVNHYEKYVNLKPIKAKTRVGFLIKTCRALLRDKIDIANFYHFKNESFALVLFCKIFKIKSYLKLDMAEYFLKEFEKNTGAKVFLKKLYFQFCVSLADIVTVEGVNTKKRMNKLFPCLRGVIYLPNGVLKETVPKISVNDNKEKTFLIVGRIGAYQKNHEAILHAVAQIEELSGWTFNFAGPVAEEFIHTFNDYCEKKPSLIHSVKISGEKNREELFELYNTSKVFIMTSRWEGFSLALLEASYMGCFIIATDVGGVQEVTKNGSFGIILESAEECQKAIEQVIQGEVDVDREYQQRKDYISSQFDMESNLRKIQW